LHSVQEEESPVAGASGWDHNVAPPPRTGKCNKDHFLIPFDGPTTQALNKAQDIQRQITRGNQGDWLTDSLNTFDPKQRVNHLSQIIQTCTLFGLHVPRISPAFLRHAAIIRRHFVTSEPEEVAPAEENLF
jgi:hypothetical protein